MNWSNVLPILSILVPVLIGLWAIMRNIKEEIQSGNAAINNKIDSVKADLDRRIDNLDHKIEVTKAELKEDNKVVRADMRSLQEMLWVSVVGKKPEFHEQSRERQQG